jgi:hypothetical protein
MATHKPIDILASFTELPPPIDYVLPNMVAGTVGALVSPVGLASPCWPCNWRCRSLAAPICWAWASCRQAE